MRAIDFHERSLLTKSMVALMQSKIKRERLYDLEEELGIKVEKDSMRFYFKFWINKLRWIDKD